MPRFDPKIIQQHAQELYDRADNLVWQAGVSGGMAGAFFGGLLGFGMHMARIGNVSPFLVAAVAAVIMGISAAVKAEREVFRLRLEAQQALCQLMIERNSSVAAKYLQEMSLRISHPSASAPNPQTGQTKA